MKYFHRVLLAALLLLLGACSAAARDRITRLTSAADPIIADKLTVFLRVKAPELIPFLDTNGDGIVTLTEIAEIDLQDPATIALLATTLSRHLQPTTAPTPAPTP